MSSKLDNQAQFKTGTVPPEIPGVIPLKNRLVARINLVGLGLPLLGFVAAIVLFWKRGIGPVEVGTFVAMYVVTGIGLSVGFHRFFSHKAFETYTAIEVLLAIAGCMATQGTALFWVATHRRHHKYSDQLGDPHSPQLHGEGIFGRLRGLWHAHTGWLFGSERTSVRRYAPDLLQNSVLLKVNRLYFVWMFMGLALPALAGGLLTWTWLGVFNGFLWGGLVRIYLGNHIARGVNSIGHVYGSQPFQTHDQSKNNFWLALVSFGDSWHNNHHAFPRAAMHGLKWWEIDLAGWVIRTLEFVGLAWNVKHPTAQRIAQKSRVGISRSTA